MSFVQSISGLTSCVRSLFHCGPAGSHFPTVHSILAKAHRAPVRRGGLPAVFYLDCLQNNVLITHIPLLSGQEQHCFSPLAPSTVWCWWPVNHDCVLTNEKGWKDHMSVGLLYNDQLYYLMVLGNLPSNHWKQNLKTDICLGVTE